MDRSDGSAPGRPDYIPPEWKLGTWVTEKPSHTFAFMVFMLLLDVALIYWLITDTKQMLLHTVYGPALPLLIVASLAMLAAYMPRAWRAMRSR